jgi:hypothetical protein
MLNPSSSSGTGDEFLDFLGINRSVLGTTQDMRRRFLRAIRTSNPEQPNVAFALTLNGDLAGYTLPNRYTQEVTIRIGTSSIQGCED